MGNAPSNYSRESLGLLSNEDLRAHLINCTGNQIFATLWEGDRAIHEIREAMDTLYPLETIDELIPFSYQYKLPHGIDENYIWKLESYDQNLFFSIFEEILYLNPELRKIDHQTNEHKINILRGIASRFPLDDIKYFCEVLDFDWSNENIKNFKANEAAKIITTLEDKVQLLMPIIDDSYIRFKEDLWEETLKNIFGKYSSFDDWIEKSANTLIWDTLYSEESIFAYFAMRDGIVVKDYPLIMHKYLRNYAEKNLLHLSDYWKSYNIYLSFNYLVSPQTIVKFYQSLW